MGKHQKNVHTLDFEGFEIQFLSTGEFAIDYREDGDRSASFKFFSTLEGAKAEAHKFRITTSAKVDLNLPVTLSNGTAVQVRRIHAGTGEWMTTPPMQRDLRAYKPCPEVDRLIALRIRLDEERTETLHHLDRYQVELKKLYFYSSYEDDKPGKIAQAQAEVKAAWDASPSD